jgi:hypothetical protein
MKPLSCNGIARIPLSTGKCRIGHVLVYREDQVRRLALALVIVVAVTVSITSPALAGGGKVRGENGQGAVNQVQVQDPPPFQP